MALRPSYEYGADIFDGGVTLKLTNSNQKFFYICVLGVYRIVNPMASGIKRGKKFSTCPLTALLSKFSYSVDSFVIEGLSGRG